MRAVLNILMLVLGIGFVTPSWGDTGIPWPWPWAKDCPIDFESLQGTFRAVGTEQDVEFIDVLLDRSSVGADRFNIEIRLLDKEFRILARGKARVFKSARSIYIPLETYTRLEMRALRLQVFQRSQRATCEPENLVPILMVANDQALDPDGSGRQMVLEPMGNPNRNNLENY
ncbi:MAG: hypothetical protein CL676_00980 [Bdellovibrionaceae bacterium]|nr:hypothetical protein [Pseudobdellovibrionaceae bacterium]